MIAIADVVVVAAVVAFYCSCHHCDEPFLFVRTIKWSSHIRKYTNLSIQRSQTSYFFWYPKWFESKYRTQKHTIPTKKKEIHQYFQLKLILDWFALIVESEWNANIFMSINVYKCVCFKVVVTAVAYVSFVLYEKKARR